MLNGFKGILKQAYPRSPEIMQSDKGSERNNTLFESFANKELHSDSNAIQNWSSASRVCRKRRPTGLEGQRR